MAGSLITLPKSLFDKYLQEAYAKGRADALKERQTKTHKSADIGGMAYKANIVFDDEESEDEQKPEQVDTER